MKCSLSSGSLSTHFQPGIHFQTRFQSLSTPGPTRAATGCPTQRRSSDVTTNLRFNVSPALRITPCFSGAHEKIGIRPHVRATTTRARSPSPRKSLPSALIRPLVTNSQTLTGGIEGGLGRLGAGRCDVRQDARLRYCRAKDKRRMSFQKLQNFIYKYI